METLIIIGILVGAISLFSSSRSSAKKVSPTQNDGPQKLNEAVVDVENITLSLEQQKLYDQIESSNQHFFITGKAGTGKSVLLRYFKAHTSKRHVVVAPTGVAALNVGGQTIHSLFKLAPAFIRPGSLTRADQKTEYLLKNLDAVVIDEISMVRADLMDAIDERLRAARNSSEPFGGVQMIMFGDLYQLPPVVADAELQKYFAHNHGGFYFFNAHAWKIRLPKVAELSQVFRQTDPEFKAILNTIRNGTVSQAQLDELNARANANAPSERTVTLASTNKSVDEINTSHLAQLPGQGVEYEAIIGGKLEEASFPTEKTLRLKQGAQVMLIKNDKEKRWVNGTVGTIAELSRDQIVVNVDGIEFPIQKESWSKIRYYYDQETRKVKEEIVSSFIQFPLRLAWAITIHKSQGQTYGSVVVDMGGGAFAHGQTYVAISRCRSLEGLYLVRPIKLEDIMVDPAVINFMMNGVGFPAASKTLAHTQASPKNAKPTKKPGQSLNSSERNRLEFFVAGPEKYALTEKGRQKVKELVALVPNMTPVERGSFTVAYKDRKSVV